MSEMPGYILRACNIFADRASKIGQASEITLPVLEEKLEELRNCGMVMPIAVPMGYEKLEGSFKMTAVDPQVTSLFGLAVGVEKEFLITGALAHENGGVVNASAYLTGRITKYDPGTWKTGELAEAEYTISFRYYRLEIDGRPILDVSPYGVSVGGISQTDAIRAALLV